MTALLPDILNIGRKTGLVGGKIIGKFRLAETDLTLYIQKGSYKECVGFSKEGFGLRIKCRSPWF